MEEKYMELYEKLSKLQWLLQRHHMQKHAEHGPMADPTRGQGRVLAMLRIQPEISSKDLSFLLGIRQQSLNELLNKLEKADYITRTPSVSDKRVMMVKLTEKGKIAQQPAADFSNIFDCLTEQEQISFGDYVDRIIGALESQVGYSVDNEEFENWIRAASSRMGNKQLERLMHMRHGGYRPDRREFEGGHGRRDHGHEMYGHGFPGPTPPASHDDYHEGRPPHPPQERQQ